MAQRRRECIELDERCARPALLYKRKEGGMGGGRRMGGGRVNGGKVRGRRGGEEKGCAP